jgi:hypothetical protein
MLHVVSGENPNGFKIIVCQRRIRGGGWEARRGMSLYGYACRGGGGRVIDILIVTIILLVEFSLKLYGFKLIQHKTHPAWAVI